MSTVAPLLPQHHSVLARSARVRAPGMATVDCTADVREGMERIALGIFTDMTNAGSTFQQALAAIYVSGLQHAIERGRVSPSSFTKE